MSMCNEAFEQAVLVFNSDRIFKESNKEEQGADVAECFIDLDWDSVGVSHGVPPFLMFIV